MSVPTKRALEYVESFRLSQERQHKGDLHSIPEWILIARRQLQKAEDAWYDGEHTRAICKLGEAAACAVAGIEQHADDVDVTPL